MKNSLKIANKFLEKHRTLIIVVCTFSNLAIFIMMAGKILGNKETMAWTSFTGPFGDTFGGIVSPLIGLASMYLIYKTFQAQTKQLEDQKKTNKRQRQEFKHTILLQKEELDDQKKTNSLSNDAFYFQQARLVITEVLNKFDKISTNVLWLSLSSGRGNLEGIDILKYFSSFETNIVDIQDEQYDALNMFYLKFKQIFSANKLAENISDDILRQIYILRLHEDLGIYLKEITSLHRRFQHRIIQNITEIGDGKAYIPPVVHEKRIIYIFFTWDRELQEMSKFITFLKPRLINDEAVKRTDGYLNKLTPDQKEYFTDLNLTQSWDIVTP